MCVALGVCVLVVRKCVASVVLYCNGSAGLGEMCVVLWLCWARREEC